MSKDELEATLMLLGFTDIEPQRAWVHYSSGVDLVVRPPGLSENRWSTCTLIQDESVHSTFATPSEVLEWVRENLR